MEDLKLVGKYTHNTQNITVEKVREFLPKGVHHKVSEEMVELMLRAEEDIGVSQEYMEEQFMSNIMLLKGSNVKSDDYVNAIKFCTLKQYMSNTKAWKIVFPDRAKRVEETIKAKEAAGNSTTTSLDTHAGAYNKTWLVGEVDKQMFVADHLQYSHMRHFAIQGQYKLACGFDARGEKVSANVQHLALSKLYDMVKMPEDNTLDIKIGISEEAKEVQMNLIEQLAANAAVQRERLIQGHSIEDVQQIGVTLDA